MAKKNPVRNTAQNVTAERAARLYRLVAMLGRGPQTRADLTRALHLNVRGFYRDLEVLRAAGLAISLVKTQYVLQDDTAVAIDHLPFPDPNLTLGEARQLSKGRSRAHQKLRGQIADIETT